MKGYRVNWRVGVSGEPYIWRLCYRFDHRRIFDGRGRAKYKRKTRSEPRLAFQVYVRGAKVGKLFMDSAHGSAVDALAAAILWRNKKIGVPLNADEYKYRDDSQRAIPVEVLQLPRRKIAPRHDEKVIPMHVYREERAAKKATPAARQHRPHPHQHVGAR